MSEILKTLQDKANPTIEVYPNIKGDNIPTGAITTPKITDGAITTAKIDDSAITTNKLNNNAVTTQKINDGAITSAKIQDLSITTAKMQDAIITPDKIINEAITTAKVQDGAITMNKIGFHLYEHNIIVASDNNLNEADDILIFKVLTNDATPYTDRSDIALLLYERGFELNKPLMATGRYSDDSFEVVTSVDFGQQSDTTDYCETYIIGVYGTSAEELKAVVCSLSENETTKIYGIETGSSYFYDNVVTLF